MKGKITITITIGLICALLTAVIFIQFKTISQTDIISFENMREDELRTEIASFKTKIEDISKKINETNIKIEEYNQTITNDAEASKLLTAELKQSRDLLGTNDVNGNGVIVTLTDNSNKQITAEDLIVLLNQLKEAGAEAISINDQRIVYDSYVISVNSTYISVNGERIVSPFIVKAIGDSKYLESGLSKKQYGYIDTKISEEKDVTLKKSEKITIYKYNGNLNFEYAKEVE